MVRYLFYTIGDLTYQSPLVVIVRKEDESRGVCNSSSPQDLLPSMQCIGDGYLIEPIYYGVVQYNTSNWGLVAGSPSADFPGR